MTPLQIKVREKYNHLPWKMDTDLLFLSLTDDYKEAYITICPSYGTIEYYSGGKWNGKEISEKEIEKYYRLETRLSIFR